MPLKRSVCRPRFDSQLSHSQREENISCSPVSLSQTPASKLRRGVKQQRPSISTSISTKTGLMLTVKFPPKNGNKSPGKRSKSAVPRWGVEPKAHQKKANTVNQGEESQSCGPGSGSVGEKDAYVFSHDKPKNGREKIKMAVLRNISRMLAENDLIRQRLESLSQVNCSHTKP